jgi:hypothetical protein
VRARSPRRFSIYLFIRSNAFILVQRLPELVGEVEKMVS